MKQFNPIKILILAALLMLVGCAGDPEAAPTAVPSATASPEPTRTVTQPLPTRTATSLPTLTLTATTVPTAAPTDIPFTGFLQYFRLFRTWYHEDQTVFYFLNAGVDFPMFARAEEYDLNCNPDPAFPKEMICVYDGIIGGYSNMLFTFFTSEAREQPVFSETFNADLVDDTIYHHQYDCPDRGKDVQCTSEYRLYDGICYYAHTCYDACGLYYSKDNLPDVYNEFQGYTTPCE